MNISKVKVNLSGEDLLSIIKEFVSIEELKIRKIEVNEDIIIYGSFKKGFTIDFEGKINVKAVEDGRIKAEITGFKVLNIGVFSFLRKIALKYALKSLGDKGINYIDGMVDIQYKFLLKDIPFVDFNIENIKCENSTLAVEIQDINISLQGKLKKEVHLFKVNEKEEENSTEVRDKVEDLYSVGRNTIENKIPVKVKRYSDYIFVIPDIAVLIYRLLKDDRVSNKTKLIISAAVTYIAVPNDFIPDKIPFIGKIDQIAVAFFALNRIVKDVPVNVILENWEGKNDIILVIKNIIEYTVNFTAASNVETLYEFINEIVTV